MHNLNKDTIIESVMRNKNVVILLVAMLVLYGIMGLINMPKQEFPVFTIREGLVIGVYPGASSLQVEEQLTKPLEEYLYGYKEVNKSRTYSVSKDGMAIVVVTLNDNVNNDDQFWSKFRHGLDEFKMQLPVGVAALIASNDFGETSAMLISLESDDKTYRELGDYLDDLETRLRQVPSVSNMRHYGLQSEQITIYLDKAKLASYKISPSFLMASLFSRGITTVSGAIENEETYAPIHVSESFSGEYDVAEQVIFADPQGNYVRLKDVARIVREYPARENYIEQNGKKCVLLSLEMLDGENIVQYGKEVKKILKEFEEELPDDVTISRVADQSEVVSNSVNTFLREMLIAICTVVLVVMLLQPLRVASIAAMTIPITIFISIGILYALGFEINTVTLAALLVVLGIIVDDSVVIIDNYLEKLDHGMPRFEASASSAKELFKSIISATLAISITFYPFLFTTTGMFHDFLLAFPWTVTITLSVSLLIAMFFIPFVQCGLIKRGLKQKEGTKKTFKTKMVEGIQNQYDKVIHLAFRFPKITVSIAVLAILAGVLTFINLPQRMMPFTERNQFAVEIFLPPGVPLDETAAVADSLENILLKDKRIVSITSFVGTTSPRFHTCYAPNFPSKSYAQFIVNTTSYKTTCDVLDEYSVKYADWFPNASIRFKQLDYVMSPTPVEIRLSCENLDRLKMYSDSVIKVMKQMDELMLIRTNFDDDLSGIAVNVNNVAANRLGFTGSAISSNIALNNSAGIPIATIWENSYPLKVVLRTDNYFDNTMDNVANDYITSLGGVSVPLRQIADIEPDWTPGQIVRRNGTNCISIYADIQRGNNIRNVVKKLKHTMDDVSLPEDVTLSWGGAQEQDEALAPMIVKGLIAAIAIIFMILVFHFKKMSLAFLILGISSLSIFGGSIGILVMHIEYGLTSVLGFVALMGIIVRNGIIMYDYAEDLRVNQGFTAHDAALEAGKRRMRPIFLTSAAASMGVVPMVLSNSALWTPMGTIICFGTWFSMVFVVTVLPVSYWLSFERADLLKNKKHHIIS